MANPTPKSFPSGRKGGKKFPQLGLEKALKFAVKLVSKTHNGPQPAAVILPGVFGGTSWFVKVNLSAVKQYGLLEGESDGYQASDLAKAIVAAPAEEHVALYRQAFVKPAIFKTLFDTFHNGPTTIGKIRQQAISLGVHPDSAEKCVEIFVGSAIFSKIATKNGDSISFETLTHSTPNETNGKNDCVTKDEESLDGEEEEQVEDEEEEQASNEKPKRKQIGGAVRVNLSLDSTMDPEKLEKSLKLLKKYGVL